MTIDVIVRRNGVSVHPYQANVSAVITIDDDMPGNTRIELGSPRELDISLEDLRAYLQQRAIDAKRMTQRQRLPEYPVLSNFMVPERTDR